MADRYIDALRQIEKAMSNTISVYDSGSSRFRDLIGSICGEKMSQRDYAKILEMYYVQYGRKKMARQQAYCLIQMQRLVLALQHPWLRRFYPRLEFSSEPLSQLEDVLKRKRSYYALKQESMEKRWFVLSTFLSILLLVLFVLVFSLPFWPVLFFCLLFLAGSYAYGHYVLIPDRLETWMRSYWNSLEKEHAKFEKSMFRLH